MEITPFDYPETKKLFGELLDTLFDESGRGAILIATAHVDDHLTQLIEAIFPKEMSKKHREKLLSYPGALSSFAAKIELSFSFRLISKALYDSLNTLRKIRNDAAHSSSKFDLFDLNEKLKNIYNLGQGIPDFISDISKKALIENKMFRLKEILESSGLPQEDWKKQYDEIFEDGTVIENWERQVPRWELVFGLTFLCGLLVYYKMNVIKLTENFYTLGDMILRK